MSWTFSRPAEAPYFCLLHGYSHIVISCCREIFCVIPFPPVPTPTATNTHLSSLHAPQPACHHPCIHACTHARFHARTHVHQATQATHQNEMRCNLCFSKTAAAAVRIWLAGCSNDTGSKAGIRRQETARPHMPTTPRRHKAAYVSSGIGRQKEEECKT